MIFAAVNSGHYLIIDYNRVIGTVKRQWKENWNKYGYREYEYFLTWHDTRPGERFNRLCDIHKKHPMDNYGGYNHILMEKKSNDINRPDHYRNRSHRLRNRIP